MENGKCGVNEINVKIMSLMFTKSLMLIKKLQESQKNAMKMIKKKVELMKSKKKVCFKVSLFYI